MSIFKFISTASLLAGFAFGQQAGPKPSPVEARIAAVKGQLQKTPTSFSSYNDLAAALCRKGRDTEDIRVYEEAERAVNRSLGLSPGNYEARKLQVAIWLGRHEFEQTLKLAMELNHKVPDDIAGWAALVDVNIALGNYSEAERQAQWVLDLRPGNTLGFEKAAALRELFGDVPGAIEFLDEANRRTSSNDTDQRAWLMTQKARLQLESGYVAEADELLRQALALFPDSQLAAGVLARIRMAQGKHAEASALLEKRYTAVKNARNLYDWAEALDRNGEKAQASMMFKRFAAEAEAESSQPFNANLQLVFFQLDRQPDPAAALVLATRMSAGRHDCATLDAYAWALYRNGKFADAKTQMDRALAVGVRDPAYFCHATRIAARTGDAVAAAGFQKELTTFKEGTCTPDEPKVLASEAKP